MSSLRQQNVHRSTWYELIGFGIKQLQRVYVPQFLAPSVNKVRSVSVNLNHGRHVRSMVIIENVLAQGEGY